MYERAHIVEYKPGRYQIRRNGLAYDPQDGGYWWPISYWPRAKKYWFRKSAERQLELINRYGL